MLPSAGPTRRFCGVPAGYDAFVGAAAEAREPFVVAIVDMLCRTRAGAAPDRGEGAFYTAKQELLDQHAAGSDSGLAIATITWDEIGPLIR